jgi:sulfite exporter TauE/SafE
MSRYKMNQYLLAFITGLTSGGISCLAVQGGLLASAVTDKSKKYESTIYFLLAKIFSYTLLGAILGAIGQIFYISLQVQGILQIAIGIFMILTVGRLLDLHPLFRYTVIQPPVFLLRMLKKKSSSDTFLTPIILGFLTVLIPCGVTQAMLVLAMGTGNPINGALIMAAFTLGTSPIFFALGLTITNIFKSNILSKIASIVILVIGLISINNGQILRNSPHTFQNYSRILFGANDTSGDSIKIVNGKQEVEIIATNSGYKTSTKNVQSCARNFIIPSLNINKMLPSSGTEIIEFTPSKEGLLNFSCGMGMYTGSFEIIK